MQKSTTIPTEQAFLQAKRIAKYAGYGAFLPTVSLSHTRAKTHKINSDLNKYQLQTSWNLFNSGADIAQIKANSFDFEAQKHQVRFTTLQMEDMTLEILFNIIKINKQIEILEQFKEIKEKSLKTTKLRFNKGLTPKEEVDKVSIDLEIADARLKDALINKENIQSELSTLLGYSDWFKFSWPWSKKLMAKSHDIKHSSFKLEQRPDYLVFENTWQKSKEFESRDFRKLFFRVDLTAAYGFTEVFPDSRQYGFSSLLTLSIPLFEGFSSYSNYKSSQAIKNSDQYKFENLKRTANAQWKHFKKQYDLAIQTANRRDQNLKLSRKLYAVNFKRFRQGRTTVNDLLLDQSRLLDSENLAIDGWLAAHQRFYQYCHALGKSIKDCI
jgi:outer membrane protein TolC